MSFDDHKNRFQALRNWFLSDQGSHVGQAFKAELEPLAKFLYGETLLQLGDCGDNPWLSLLHYNRKWLAGPYFNSSNSMISALNSLPLDRHSIDCVIAPLTMEAFTHQKNPIDEIDRILKPMGYAVFFGINPMSLWGWMMRFGWHTCFGTLRTHSMSVFFIKRAMLHRNYIQCHLSSFYFIPPVYKENWINRLEFLNEVGKMMWPCPAGFYCFVVQKYEEGFTALHPEVVEEELLDRESLPLQTLFK
ncbi:methyltransferase domain-containing protein [Legionella hackeliae]|uniref:Generic methyl-transferase n=1 Tax=Legionella hackeliae TaxID=449 RepID=A0A0A8UT57_LEGHA|nr:methyltransferase domain-containing protein [Legionella hackeliae]KTD11496.1 methyl-transferase [Legionella hackeliae]CEK10671.1 Generic methyl-transferase [Legionella hackeliae]STX47418.1 methyl-transferase [Legionella hackeliae]